MPETTTKPKRPEAGTSPPETLVLPQRDVRRKRPPMLSFLLRWEFDPLTLIFLPAGLITAALYWWIGSRMRG